MIRTYYPPGHILGSYSSSIRIFLGGTIDMGNSIDWQAEFIQYAYEQYNTGLYNIDNAIFNPRRPDWDSNWEQKITNPEFRRQVEWELGALEQSTHIIINLLPNSASPISLLELGLFKDKNIYVVCPEEYYRSGNVYIVCERYGIPVYNTTTEIFNIINQI